MWLFRLCEFVNPYRLILIPVHTLMHPFNQSMVHLQVRIALTLRIFFGDIAPAFRAQSRDLKVRPFERECLAWIPIHARSALLCLRAIQGGGDKLFVGHKTVDGTGFFRVFAGHDVEFTLVNVVEVERPQRFRDVWPEGTD